MQKPSAVTTFLEDRVIEECSELIQAIMKARRFGYENWHPSDDKRRNWSDIIYEIKDISKTSKKLEQALRKEFSV